ncbi:MAG: flagellar hook-length control protein FliK [Lachnospiraceae bacterium]|nr:flagellar hook-length control protein FliK [Lachnospiraceae bacterium]
MTSASIVNVPINTQKVSANAGNKAEAGGEDFVKMMSKSFSNVNADSMAQTEAADRKDSNVSKASDQDDSDTYKFEKKVGTKLKSKETAMEEAKDTAEEAVEKFDSEIREELKSKLGISDEELDNLLNSMGLVIQDLMQPQNLVAVVGELTGNTDSLGMLLDENISSILSNVHDVVQSLTKEIGMDVSNILALTEPKDNEITLEEVTFELQELGFTLEDVTPEVFENLPEELQQKIQDLTVNPVSEPVEEDQVEVTVVTETPVVFRSEAEVEELPVDETEETVEPEAEVVTTTDSSETPDESTKNGTDQAKEELLDRSLAERDPSPTVFHSSATFTQTMESVSVEATTTTTTTTSQIDVQRMITDIVNQAKVTITEEVQTMEMVLNPEHLGKLFMEVTAKDGQISAKIYTENEAVKNALENQLVVFKENMNQQGMKIDAVEVSVGTHEFERNLEERASDQERRDAENLMQQDKNNQKNGRMRNIDLNNLDNLQGLMSEEEQLVAQIMKDNGNTVNYMA